MTTPVWLRLLFFAISPKYRRGWRSLEQRALVTGTAREEKVLWKGPWGYRLTLNRMVKRKID